MSETLDSENSLEFHKKYSEEEIKEINQPETVYWKEECMKGNFMPGVLMIEQKRISVDDEVNPQNGNTLLHYAANYNYYNVIRALIEIYHADINKQNKAGQTPLFYIVSNLDRNIFNFQYFAKLKKIKYDLIDKNGYNIIIHSIITNFHYAFLYFAYQGLIDQYHDKYSNPLIYYTIINNNKFALSYLLFKKNCNINDSYCNNTAVLSDILITNKYNSITKFLIKYFNDEIELKTIHTCKKYLLNFPMYNLFNYELLNTLYFYKKNSYFSFLLSLLKTSKPKFYKDTSQILLDDNLVNNDIGYRYKMVNIKYMLYDLILPNISPSIKMIIFLLYLTLLFFITIDKRYFYFLYNEYINISKYNIIYNIFSFISLYMIFICMFYSNDKLLNNDKEIEPDIVNIINNGNVIDLPSIDEICPSCGTRKDLSDSHCYRCKGCFSNRFFHSNLFQICITKYNIKRYLSYVLLKINFYFICLYNCLRKNPTNKSLFAFMYIFRYKTGFFNSICQLILGFLLFKELGHFLAMILSLIVKTPYHFIYKYHKKVYPNTLKQKAPNNMVVQSPEVNEYISFKTGFNNLIDNIC
jgi:hypothetical protein